MNQHAQASELAVALTEAHIRLKSTTETHLTYALKWAAWQWLYEIAQCRTIGMEVKLEGPGGRIVDLVGIGKDNVVFIVEVKSSRADMRRDHNSKSDQQRNDAEVENLQRAADLTAIVLDDARQAAIESAQGGQDWKASPTYRLAKADHDEVNERLAAKRRRSSILSTKFHDPRFLACADFHYIMAPAGMMSRSELPPFWGLLNDVPETVVEAVPKQIRRNTLHVMRAIARANTRDLMKVTGYGSANRRGADRVESDA